MSEDGDVPLLLSLLVVATFWGPLPNRNEDRRDGSSIIPLKDENIADGLELVNLRIPVLMTNEISSLLHANRMVTRH